MKNDKYPTWRRVKADLYVSEEQIDGEPDFLVWRDETKRWRSKWRTSACWSIRSYETADAAKRDIEEQTRKK